MADQAAKQAAQGVSLLPVMEKSKTPEPGQQYSLEDLWEIKKLDPFAKIPEGTHYDSDGKEISWIPEGTCYTSDGKEILPQKEGLEYVQQIHCLTHLGVKHLQRLVKTSPY